MASQAERDSDWNKKRQQTQPFINKIRSVLEKKARTFEQIGFLRRCQKEKLTPKGLRVKLPTNISGSQFGGRLQSRSEKRVVKRTIGDLFVKIKNLDEQLADLKLHLNVEMGFSNKWINKIVIWVQGSLKEFTSKVKAGLKKKLVFLRKQREEIQRTQVKKKRKLDTKVVYNNSSRHLTDEQIELLSLGLNFGIAPKKFPLLEYVTAAEVLCQRLEEVGDAESIEKARYVRNEVFLHLKRSYKMTIKSNLTPDQRRVLKELKEDDTIIICPIKGRQWWWRTGRHTWQRLKTRSMRGIMCYQTRVKNYITKVAQEIDGSNGGNEDNRFQGAEEICSDWSCNGIDSVVGKSP